MSTRSFTKEEQTLLKKNKYTYNVSVNTISFTIDFKKEFWKRYSNTGNLQALGYDFQMLGETRVADLQSMIKKQAKEGKFREGQHASQASFIHLCQTSKSCTQWSMSYTIYAMQWSF